MKELVRLLPDEKTYYISLSQTYDEAGDHDRAISILDQLIRRWPNDTFSHKVRSNFYASAGEIDKALADANEIIRLKPDDPEGYSYRAHYYVVKSDFDKAIADLTQAIRLDRMAPPPTTGCEPLPVISKAIMCMRSRMRHTPSNWRLISRLGGRGRLYSGPPIASPGHRPHKRWRRRERACRL